MSLKGYSTRNKERTASKTTIALLVFLHLLVFLFLRLCRIVSGVETVLPRRNNIRRDRERF